ncbi:MAG: hypothetical protein Kow0032_07770 [Methyloligellaceae bacterium]
MPSRFEINYSDPDIAWEPLVDEVFAELTSSFLELPKGEGFIDYPTFEKGYQVLKRSTDAFVNFTPETVLAAVREVPIAFIVFRCMLGFSPPEWAYVTTEMTSAEVDQGAARGIDRKIRLNPLTPMKNANNLTAKRIGAMIEAGVRTIEQGAGNVPPGFVHRLARAALAHVARRRKQRLRRDRLHRRSGLQSAARGYAAPFAGHRREGIYADDDAPSDRPYAHSGVSG